MSHNEKTQLRSSMTDKRDRLLACLNVFKQKADSCGQDLRLGLADLVIAQLKSKGWTHARLASVIGMKPSQLSRVINAEANFTADVAGRILKGLGLRATISIVVNKEVTNESFDYSTGIHHGETNEIIGKIGFDKTNSPFRVTETGPRVANAMD